MKLRFLPPHSRPSGSRHAGLLLDRPDQVALARAFRSRLVAPATPNGIPAAIVIGRQMSTTRRLLVVPDWPNGMPATTRMRPPGTAKSSATALTRAWSTISS